MMQIPIYSFEMLTAEYMLDMYPNHYSSMYSLYNIVNGILYLEFLGDDAEDDCCFYLHLSSMPYMVNIIKEMLSITPPSKMITVEYFIRFIKKTIISKKSHYKIMI